MPNTDANSSIFSTLALLNTAQSDLWDCIEHYHNLELDPNTPSRQTQRTCWLFEQMIHTLQHTPRCITVSKDLITYKGQTLSGQSALALTHEKLQFYPSLVQEFLHSPKIQKFMNDNEQIHSTESLAAVAALWRNACGQQEQTICARLQLPISAAKPWADRFAPEPETDFWPESQDLLSPTLELLAVRLKEGPFSNLNTAKYMKPSDWVNPFRASNEAATLCFQETHAWCATSGFQWIDTHSFGVHTNDYIRQFLPSARSVQAHLPAPELLGLCGALHLQLMGHRSNGGAFDFESMSIKVNLLPKEDAIPVPSALMHEWAHAAEHVLSNHHAPLATQTVKDLYQAIYALPQDRILGKELIDLERKSLNEHWDNLVANTRTLLGTPAVKNVEDAFTSPEALRAWLTNQTEPSISSNQLLSVYSMLDHFALHTQSIDQFSIKAHHGKSTFLSWAQYKDQFLDATTKRNWAFQTYDSYWSSPPELLARFVQSTVHTDTGQLPADLTHSFAIPSGQEAQLARAPIQKFFEQLHLVLIAPAAPSLNLASFRDQNQMDVIPMGSLSPQAKPKPP